MDDVLLGDGRFLIICTKETERLFSAVGENSIDFPRILYRLFPNASVQTLGGHGSNDLIVWEHRSVPIVQSLRFFSRKGATVRGNRVKVRRCEAALWREWGCSCVIVYICIGVVGCWKGEMSSI